MYSHLVARFHRPVVFLLLFIFLAACGNRESKDAKHYELKGTVVSVDRRGETITIAHHEIRGYMEAMTMPFRPRESWVLDKAQPGDQIQATLVVDGLRSWLDNVVLTQENADPSGGPAKPVEPQAGDIVPEFKLTNQDGNRISLRDYRGRALAITFIYTRCPLPDYCPLITSHFEELARSLNADPESLKTIHLLSVTLDPGYDTPAVLRAYGAKYTGQSGSAAFSRWEFATGKPEEIKQIAGYLGLEYWPQGDQVVHSLRTAIVGPDGKLVKLYHGSEWEPAEVLAELNKLKATAADLARDAGSAQKEKAPGKDPTAQNALPPASPVADADRVYRGTGVVITIAENRKTIELNHDDIKDLMPAMQMSFEVKSAGLLEGISTGDRVEFGIQALPRGMVVVEIRKR